MGMRVIVIAALLLVLAAVAYADCRDDAAATQVSSTSEMTFSCVADCGEPIGTDVASAYVIALLLLPIARLILRPRPPTLLHLA